MAASRARREVAAIRAELEAESLSPAPVVHGQRAPSAAADEQVARAYMEAKSLAGVLARLGVDAQPALAWRCARVAQALIAAINETLGEE